MIKRICSDMDKGKHTNALLDHDIKRGYSELKENEIAKMSKDNQTFMHNLTKHRTIDDRIL